ncbi:extracellular solute-binding protein [Cohnella sp. CFH 77786]|uniref:ABC transporter substrate-binding protein n=1 Tax=Cohnella sp. CFH 77786 TaxID=2662265 RepID=UPI001C60B8FC|nr:extracellular solute-binding protein [Cohnella sp. CFH 77786]MBW5444766.1 extracellular solute-binding protein [Cohnella sp. CFH 77786]
MKHEASRVRRWTLIGLALSLFIPLLAACSPTKDPNDPANRRTLRIGTMYGSKQDETYFRQQFTDLFEYSHKGIDIEIVPAIDWSQQQFENMDDDGRFKQPDTLGKVKEIMSGTNPVDVMIFDLNLLGSLVNENMLKQLDPMLKEDKIDVNAFVPSVIEAIRDQGNGNLYALTPTFMPSALYYNKKLFQKMGVTPPKDGMNWDEVFALARQMTKGTGKDAVFGFSFNQWGGTGENYWDIQNFAAPLQLKLYDDKAEKMTVNTPQWQNLWETVYKLYKDHIVPHQEDMNVEPPADGKYRYNPYQGRLFMTGRVAMTIGEYGMINDIQQMNDNADKLKIEKLDWDVVTVPFHASVPNVGVNTQLSSLAGINAKAQNQEDAWEFVKFMNGEDWAKFKSRSTYEMPARVDYIKPREGMNYNMQAFTKMKPAPMPGSSPAEQRLLQEKPNLSMMQDLVQRAYSSVFQGQRSVKEALEYLDTKGNELLQKIKTNPDGPIEGIFDDVYGGGGPKPFDAGTAEAVPAG